MKETRTIGIIGDSHSHRTAKDVAAFMQTKYSVDVCCVLSELHEGGYHLFAHCSAQLHRRMVDFFDGWKSAQ
jgi:hypothetical protein